MTKIKGNITRPGFTLNWFGMAVQDVPVTTDFYSEKLGFAFWLDENKDQWCQFTTRRMTFELFKAHPERFEVRAWGDGQAFRPAILVSDLSASAAMLRDQGISHFHEISEFGPQIEMIGPDGVRWSLGEDPKIDMDWVHPIIGGIELKAANLEAQNDFYTRVFGMASQHKTDQAVQLSHPSGEAWLRIQAGGSSTALQAGTINPTPAFFFPIWISFETQDILQANAWLLRQEVTILRPFTYHADWDGTDVILADVDGNAIQVVQYGKHDRD